MANTPKAGPVAAHAAAALASATSPDDAPSELDTDLDLDFIAGDSTDLVPHFKKHGIKLDPAMHYRWCETDQRLWNKRLAQGWQPTAGGKIRRGSVMCCEMPKVRADAFKARIQQRTNELSHAPMRRFEQEADRMRGKHIDTFDGSRNARDGL